jgi:hypothetical protein
MYSANAALAVFGRRKMLVQRPQDNEALRGIDGYEQMVNTFAKNAKAYWRLWGPRRGDLGGAAMFVPAVATAKLWRGQSSLAFRLLQVIGPGHPLRGAPAPYCERSLITRGGEMSFRPGDRVRWSGKTGTVLSEPRQYDYARGARGDPFTVVGVEVMPDKSIYGAGATLVHVATLTRLDGPEAVVVVVLDHEEKLEEIARADPLRGVETVEHAALRLQKQIIQVIRRATELGPAFRCLGSRVTIA